MSPLPKNNHLLAALSPEVQDRLYPQLEIAEVSHGDVVYESNDIMRYVYFPAGAILSVQYVLRNGDSNAIMVIGREGLLGMNLCLAGEKSPTRAIVQSGGYTYRLPKRLVRQEFDRHEELLLLMLRYTQALITQVSQTAVCNRRHSIDQQLCRWLLLSLDRLPDNRLTMTQQFISNMIGVRREGVTQAATKLRDLGIISYARGVIEVLDRPRLESLSCECYAEVKRETDALLDYLPQRQTLKSSESVPTASIQYRRRESPVERRVKNSGVEPSLAVGRSGMHRASGH